MFFERRVSVTICSAESFFDEFVQDIDGVNMCVWRETDAVGEGGCGESFEVVWEDEVASVKEGACAGTFSEVEHGACGGALNDSGVISRGVNEREHIVDDFVGDADVIYHYI